LVTLLAIPVKTDPIFHFNYMTRDTYDEKSYIIQFLLRAYGEGIEIDQKYILPPLLGILYHGS
jgi:hypothetical protein